MKTWLRIAGGVLFLGVAGVQAIAGNYQQAAESLGLAMVSLGFQVLPKK